MTRPARIFVVGSVNEDIMISTPVYPALGETVQGSTIERSPGGKGANQAVAAAAMGAPTTMVALVGDDAAGAAMRENLAERGVNTDRLEVAEHTPTGQALVVRTDDGQNAIIVIGGANAAVDADFAASGLEELRAGDVLLLQHEIPAAANARALEIARERGALTIVNAAPAARIDALLPYVDVLVVNEFELAVVAGGEEGGDPAAVAAQLAAQRRLSVIVTLGAQGAALATATDTHRVAAHPIDAVDSTGAGDTYVGALAAFLLDGHPLETAARWASAAGAHACLHVGAQAGSPTPAQLAEVFGVGPAREDAA
ncbi:ribokinase [Agrococcus sp. HG114]|uniref:ribokinase n=1 Tax=Agrococcus sp. HG114 TaxID=2969757 RepID=UPI00215A3382|nr:ribokinase [Agrococcus sp. HG114]MCR8669776.1 ribokinase [Agrococcus sp. HG114]